MIRHLLAPLSIILTPAFAQAEQPAISPYETICVEEQSTGFNWENGKWQLTRFKAGTGILIQKLDPAAFASKPMNERPIRCTAERSTTAGMYTFIRSCYLVRESGMYSGSILSSKMCTEKFRGAELESVTCEQITFHPDGDFVMRRPPDSDIRKNPDGGYKDSLVLSVGSCDRLVE